VQKCLGVFHFNSIINRCIYNIIVNGGGLLGCTPFLNYIFRLLLVILYFEWSEECIDFAMMCIFYFCICHRFVIISLIRYKYQKLISSSSTSFNRWYSLDKQNSKIVRPSLWLNCTVESSAGYQLWVVNALF